MVEEGAGEGSSYDLKPLSWADETGSGRDVSIHWRGDGRDV